MPSRSIAGAASGRLQYEALTCCLRLLKCAIAPVKCQRTVITCHRIVAAGRSYDAESAAGPVACHLRVAVERLTSQGGLCMQKPAAKKRKIGHFSWLTSACAHPHTLKVCADNTLKCIRGHAETRRVSHAGHQFTASGCKPVMLSFGRIPPMSEGRTT